ncbi:hypothetical protein L1999_13205 [Neobacillus drentensis]|uniref:hypothetical protein n=1 Tax=Neobacillus drentensis TaxID=220684 RepID=UPI001F160ED8|nr:hypothetical protein [Neobacillus drentensis]ULT59420.1 hypothetical protein L1999_13205 [Neobacillus drentensis]
MEWPIRLALILAGFLFIINLPFLLGIGKTTILVNFEPFWASVITDFQRLLDIKNSQAFDLLRELTLFESYSYTMKILLGCLLVVMILSTVLSILVMMAPSRIRTVLKRMIDFFEAVPDLLMIFFIQFFVIMLFKTTGVKLMQLYGVFGARPYFVPIVTISFLPLFLLTQFLVKILAEEQTQLYALFGTAKGLSRMRILLVHIFWNVLPLFVLQLRTIVWVILSTIYLVEYMFNLPGFTRFFELILFRGGDIVSLIICLLMFMFPLLIIEVQASS